MWSFSAWAVRATGGVVPENGSHHPRSGDAVSSSVRDPAIPLPSPVSGTDKAASLHLLLDHKFLTTWPTVLLCVRLLPGAPDSSSWRKRSNFQGVYGSKWSPFLSPEKMFISRLLLSSSRLGCRIVADLFGSEF